MLPDPSSATETLVPFSWPFADADTVRPLPHDAVKVPAIVVAVCDAIWYWKLPHVLAEGRLADTDEVHTPTIEGELLVVEVGPGVGVPDGVVEPLADVDEGESTLDVCSKPQAPNAAAATRTASRETDRLCLMVTNLSVDTRFSWRSKDAFQVIGEKCLIP